jgi:hypothetical protein
MSEPYRVLLTESYFVKLYRVLLYWVLPSLTATTLDATLHPPSPVQLGIVRLGTYAKKPHSLQYMSQKLVTSRKSKSWGNRSRRDVLRLLRPCPYTQVSPHLSRLALRQNRKGSLKGNSSIIPPGPECAHTKQLGTLCMKRHNARKKQRASTGKSILKCWRVCTWGDSRLDDCPVQFCVQPSNVTVGCGLMDPSGSY